MNRSQIIYRLWKTVLLLVSGAVLSSGVAWAQSADDVTMTAVATDAHCVQDGSVTINVVKKEGSPYNFTSGNVSYDLRDSKGNSLAGASGQFVLNNTFGGLKKGAYKAYAKVRFDNSVEVTLDPISVTVNSDYKIPTVAIKLERKTLKSYKESGQRVPTGIISVMVTGGNRPEYKVKMVETPSNYTGIKEHVLTPDVKIYFYNLLEGTYKFQVYDQCGGQEVQTIEMQTVAFDAPQGGVVPFGTHPRSSDATRNQCGWFFFPYQNRGVAQFEGQDQDLQPYLSPTGMNLSSQGGSVSPRDTLAKYYDYGFAYGNNKPSRYYAADERTFQSNMSGTEIAADKNKYTEVYGRILEGKKWSDAGFVNMKQKPWVNTMDHNVFPGLFLRVKGSPDEMLVGYRSQRIRTEPEEFTTRWYTIVDSCNVTYRINVKASELATELYCFPVNVGLFDTDKSTRLGTSGDLTLTRTGQAVNFDGYVLQPDKQYWIKATDGTGSYVEYPVILRSNFEYRSVVRPSKDLFDICARKRATSIELFRYTPTTLPFLNHSVTLQSAPPGYMPAEDGLAVGEKFVFPKNFPASITSVSRFYAFGKKSQYFTIPREIYAPNGKYVFEIVDHVCNKTFYVEAEITTGQTPKWEVKEENFKPRLVNASCGRVRIHPFTPENRTNFLFKDGVAEPMDLMFYIAEFPAGLRKEDVTHNQQPGSAWVWSYYEALWFGANQAKPEDLYFELPKTNGHLSSTYKCNFLGADNKQ